MWVRRIFQERKQKGEFHLLVQDMRLFDREYFFRYFRMTVIQYEDVLQLVAPMIMKSGEKREPISPSERLSVTLKILNHGKLPYFPFKQFSNTPNHHQSYNQRDCYCYLGHAFPCIPEVSSG